MLSPFAVTLSQAKGLQFASLRVNSVKHPQYLVQNKQMHILRSAQDDRQWDFFRSLLVLNG